MERIPLSRFERRKMLREIEGKDRRVEELGTLDAWPGIRSSRGETFYEGIIGIEQLKAEMEKAQNLIEGIESLIG